MSTGGATVVVVVVGAGYEGKRRYYQRLAGLGARLVIVDEPGHWSQSLTDQIAGARWVAAPISGNPDSDAGELLAATDLAGLARSVHLEHDLAADAAVRQGVDRRLRLAP